MTGEGVCSGGVEWTWKIPEIFCQTFGIAFRFALLTNIDRFTRFFHRSYF